LRNAQRDFSTMCSAFAERDERFARDVSCRRDVPAGVGARNTSHHFAAKPQNITASEAKSITCATGRKHHEETD
jgi:hypothetical protein